MKLFNFILLQKTLEDIFSPTYFQLKEGILYRSTMTNIEYTFIKIKQTFHVS